MLFRSINNIVSILLIIIAIYTGFRRWQDQLATAPLFIIAWINVLLAAVYTITMNYFGFGLINPGENNIIVDFHNDKFTINDCALLSFPSDETPDKIKQEFKQLSY